MVLSVSLQAQQLDLEKYREAAVKEWELDILKLEKRDQAEVHTADSILFIGSSSIRRWKTIAPTMAPYPVIQRGFGGSSWDLC